jgi:hypothetical protein
MQIQHMTHSGPPLDRDLDLCLLASNAAVELDDLLLGRSSHMDSVHELAEILGRIGEPDTAESPLAMRVDPYAALVVSNALDESRWCTPLATLADLAREAGTIAARLHDSRTSQSDSIERMRSFCIALSKSAAAYGDSLKALRPRRPFGM